MSQKIFTHVYANGMVLLAEPNPSLESVAFTFLSPSGCRYDPIDQAGLATMSADMALRGAGNRDSRQFINDLETLGVNKHEAVTNAHTSFSGAMLAENLSPALDIYADLLRRPVLPNDKLEEARQVVLLELVAIEDDPSHKVMLELRRRHYPDPYGRSSQGDLAGIQSITQQDVERYCRNRYRPQGTILGVAGKFDWEQLRDHVGELFGDWPEGREEDIAETEIGEKIVHLEHDSSQTQIGIAYESVAYSNPDYFQASGAIGVLSGGMSSRLFTEVREKRGLCYSVYATPHSLEHRGAVLCYAGTSAERAQETLDVTLGELVRLSQGVEAAELDRLKARIKSGLIMQQESSSARSSSLARDWHHLKRGRTLEEVGEIVDRLSCETINKYLAEHPARDFTIVTLGQQPLEVTVGVS
ncbi:MAG: insulinase family protein [Planctomycetales bacterium]|nr:insulinase family protein [Planctomycetales bacterium]